MKVARDTPCLLRAHERQDRQHQRQQHDADSNDQREANFQHTRIMQLELTQRVRTPDAEGAGALTPRVRGTDAEGAGR